MDKSPGRIEIRCAVERNRHQRPMRSARTANRSRTINIEAGSIPRKAIHRVWKIFCRGCGSNAISLLMITAMSQRSSVAGDRCQHPRVGPKLREPVPCTEPAHDPVNITVAELAGSTALGAPRRGLFRFSVGGGSHDAALRVRFTA